MRRRCKVRSSSRPNGRRILYKAAGCAGMILVLAFCLLGAGGCGCSPEDELSDLQLSISEQLKALEAAGLPVPEVSFDHGRTTDPQTGITSEVANTTISFANPQEAGLDEWPDMVVPSDGFLDTSPDSDLEAMIPRGGPQVSQRAMYALFQPILGNTDASPVALTDQGDEDAEDEDYSSPDELDSIDTQASGESEPMDYTQGVKDALEEESPEIWDEYEFGQEPREYEIEEVTETVYEPTELSEPDPRLGHDSDTQDLVFGFDWDLEKAIGHDLDKTIRLKAKLPGWLGGAKLFDFKAGFELSCSIGLRMPVEVQLDTDTPDDGVKAGQTFTPKTQVKGLNWSAKDYAAVGMPQEKGSEFYLHFTLFAGVKLWIKGFGDVLDDFNVDCKIDQQKDFTTPLGSTVSLGKWRLKPSATHLRLKIFGCKIGVGIILEPQIGGDQIAASWEAIGSASGSGSVTYTSNALVSLPRLKVEEGSADAVVGVRLEDFVYTLDKFKLRTGFWVEVDPPLFKTVKTGDVTWNNDLSKLLGNVGLPVYSGTRDYIEAWTASNNSDPVVYAGAGFTMPQGETVTRTVAFKDSPSDKHQARVRVDGGDWYPAKVASEPVKNTVRRSDEPEYANGKIEYQLSGLQPGMSYVEIEVTDDKGGRGRGSLYVAVSERENTPPVVGEIALEPSDPSYNTEVTVSALVDDGALLWMMDRMGNPYEDRTPELHIVVPATPGNPLAGKIIDDDPRSLLVAEIDWGDGTTSEGTIRQRMDWESAEVRGDVAYVRNQGWEVVGSHTYPQPPHMSEQEIWSGKRYTITITLTDPYGATGTGTTEIFFEGARSTLPELDPGELRDLLEDSGITYEDLYEYSIDPQSVSPEVRELLEQMQK